MNFIKNLFSSGQPHKPSLPTPPRDEILWILEPGARKKILTDSLPEWKRQAALEFIDDGFTVLKGSLTPETCDRARSAFEGWCSRNASHVDGYRDKDGHFPRIINLHEVLPELRDVFTLNQRALDLQDYLFGYPVTLYTTLFYERGSGQSTHRDIPYFCTKPLGFYFGMWTALETVDLENGPLEVVPGGHKIVGSEPESIAQKYYADLDKIDPYDSRLWDDYQAEINALCKSKGLTSKPVPVSKGDTILWHPLLPHGGASIVDFKRTRYSLVMHTTPENVPVFHQDVFFNYHKPVPSNVRWTYRTINDRRIAFHNGVSIGHGAPLNLSEFN